MTLAALDHISAVTLCGPGYQAPQAPPRPVDPAPNDNTPYLRRQFKVHNVKPARARRAEWVPAVSAQTLVLACVEREPGCTAQDVRRRMRRDGHNQGLSYIVRVLSYLEGLRRVDRVNLHSQRDIDRVGARWLWHVAERGASR